MILTPLPLTTYPAGQHVLPEAPIPTGFVLARAIFDVTHLAALTLVMHFDFELSQDSGATWVYAGGGGFDLTRAGWTITGGVITDSGGRVITTSTLPIKLPNPANVQRKIRGTVTLSEDFLTQITVELT